MNVIQDQELLRVQRLQARDESALAELYDQHNALLYAVVLRILRSPTEAEDVLQEAWLQIWNRAESYDPGRGPVGAWILTIARSRALDRYRSLSARRRAEIRRMNDVETVLFPDPSVPSMHAELQRHVLSALRTLQPQQRQ